MSRVILKVKSTHTRRILCRVSGLVYSIVYSSQFSYTIRIFFEWKFFKKTEETLKIWQPVNYNKFLSTITTTVLTSYFFRIRNEGMTLLFQIDLHTKRRGHYGSKQHESITFPRAREWLIEWASERMSAAERTNELSSEEQGNEWTVRANERMDELVAQYKI